jgi:hypothetical protein
VYLGITTEKGGCHREKQHSTPQPQNLKFLKGANYAMQTVKNTAAKTAAPASGREPLILRKRIGSSTFTINVFTSPSATETAEQKLFRVIESEVRKNA